jgi:ribosomal protein S18 acetylase RimI-like enzyme
LGTETITVGTKYPKSAQTGDEGVAIVRKIATRAGAIFRTDVPDLGLDGHIEFLTDVREPSGDIVFVQIKCGPSYIRGGRFYVDTDRAHFETWSRYSVPIVGIVCSPHNDEARWVEISAHLIDHPDAIANGPYSIEAPSTQPFSVVGFAAFVDRFRRSRTPVTRVDKTPNLLIRPWEAGDLVPTQALLQPIALDYPGFDKWLKGKLNNPDASKKVVELGSAIAAFSMWQSKDARNVKLQTFMVGPLFRGTAIGQHLLYHELRTWERMRDLVRVHVTVSSSKADLIDYFTAFGFRVEGFAPNRYERAGGAAELVMAKHFVRKTIRTPVELRSAVDDMTTRLWGLRAGAAARFEVTGTNLGVPAQLPSLSLDVNASSRTVSSRVTLAAPSGEVVVRYDDASLMQEFYPLRIHLERKRYVLVPIFKHWVDAMLSTSGPETRLKLRIDNAYYCYPKVSDLARGDLVIFYEAKAGGGRGAAIGSAVVLATAIETPSDLHARFGQIGVYTLADIAGHAKTGKAMAIHFGLFEPFSKAVTLARIRAILGNGTNVQGLTPIGRDPFEKIRSEGIGQL